MLCTRTVPEVRAARIERVEADESVSKVTKTALKPSAITQAERNCQTAATKNLCQVV